MADTQRRITVRIPPDQDEVFQATAAASGMTESLFVLRAVQTAIGVRPAAAPNAPPPAGTIRIDDSVRLDLERWAGGPGGVEAAAARFIRRGLEMEAQIDRMRDALTAQVADVAGRMLAESARNAAVPELPGNPSGLYAPPAAELAEPAGAFDSNEGAEPGDAGNADGKRRRDIWRRLRRGKKDG